MRYAHTNIVTRDWRALSEFYVAVFGCRVTPPRRQQAGAWLERGTGVRDAALEGVHLLLPGHGENGPTLEIYSYTQMVESEPGPANRVGLGHLAFEVEEVPATVQALLDHGGSLIGRVTEKTIEGVGQLAFVYARDPDGNILEIQSWSK